MPQGESIEGTPEDAVAWLATNLQHISCRRRGARAFRNRAQLQAHADQITALAAWPRQLPWVASAIEVIPWAEAERLGHQHRLLVSCALRTTADVIARRVYIAPSMRHSPFVTHELAHCAGAAHSPLWARVWTELERALDPRRGEWVEANATTAGVVVGPPLPDVIDQPDTYGGRIEVARHLAGLSREELAAPLGVSSTTVGRWERDLGHVRRQARAVETVTGVPRFWLQLAENPRASLDESWGERLRRARSIRSMSKHDLAQQVGVSINTVTRLEARHLAPDDPAERAVAGGLVDALQFPRADFHLDTIGV